MPPVRRAGTSRHIQFSVWGPGIIILCLAEASMWYPHLVHVPMSWLARTSGLGEWLTVNDLRICGQENILCWLYVLCGWRYYCCGVQDSCLPPALCDHTLSPCGLCVCVLCVVYVFSVLLSCTLSWSVGRRRAAAGFYTTQWSYEHHATSVRAAAELRSASALDEVDA